MGCQKYLRMTLIVFIVKHNTPITEGDEVILRLLI